MYIGDKVETTCEYSKSMHGAYLKGVIREVSKTDDKVVEVEKPCGCKTWINKHWLKKRHCHCHCCCAH